MPKLTLGIASREVQARQREAASPSSGASGAKAKKLPALGLKLPPSAIKGGGSANERGSGDSGSDESVPKLSLKGLERSTKGSSAPHDTQQVRSGSKGGGKGTTNAAGGAARGWQADRT